MAAKGRTIKVKAKLEVFALCPDKTLKILQGKEYRMKFKPVQVAGKLNLANKDFQKLTPAKFPDAFKNTMRRELAIFHVRAEQELEKIKTAKSGRDRSKFKKNFKMVMEKTAKDIHKAAPIIFKEMQEAAGKETSGAALPKGSDKNLKGVNKSVAGMKKDMDTLAEKSAEAQKALSSDPDMSKQEKAKYLKPLTNLISAVEKSQKGLVVDLKKTRNLTKDIDPKTADNRAKKLSKKSKAMDDAAKKFVAHAKSTGRKSAVIVAKLAANDYASEEAVTQAISDIYAPQSLTDLEDGYLEFTDDAKKLKKAA